MNKLVAAKVMGWRVGTGEYLTKEDRHAGWLESDERDTYEPIEAWSPSTDIAAAWEVVKKLGEFRGGPHNIYKPVIRLEYYEHDGIATVGVGRCKGMDEVVASAEVWEEHGDANADQAMALAICRAALKAVGVSSA